MLRRGVNLGGNWHRHLLVTRQGVDNHWRAAARKVTYTSLAWGALLGGMGLKKQKQSGVLQDSGQGKQGKLQWTGNKPLLQASTGMFLGCKLKLPGPEETQPPRVVLGKVQL